jgi:predicted nucleic-acid-binding Zn-ribbon protein
MAISKCPKCDHTSFEGKEIIMAGVKYNPTLIQCASCGCVVGTTNEKQVDGVAKIIVKLIKEFAHKLGHGI